jgi:hypothetical protein
LCKKIINGLALSRCGIRRAKKVYSFVSEELRDLAGGLAKTGQERLGMGHRKCGMRSAECGLRDYGIFTGGKGGNGEISDWGFQI